MATELDRLIVRIESDVSQLKRGLREAQTASAGASRAISGQFRMMDSSFGGLIATVRRFAPALGVLTVGAAFTSVIRSTAEFQKGLSSLSAITGAVGKDLDFLAMRARAMARESTVGATDTLRAFQLIASAKPDLLEDVRALDKVTEAAITLSEASGQALPAAANTLTTALNQFRAGADQSARFINVLAAGAQKGAVEIGPFATALTKAGTVAADAGISFEEFTATVQTLAQFGTPLEQIGTSLRNIFLKMQAAGRDTNPAIVGLDQAIANMGQRLKTTADFTKAFGLENVVVAKQLFDMIDKIEELRKGLTGTNQAYDQAATRTDNLSDDLTKLGHSFENVSRSIGEMNSGVLRLAIEGFTELNNAIAAGNDALDEMESHRREDFQPLLDALDAVLDRLNRMSLFHFNADDIYPTEEIQKLLREHFIPANRAQPGGVTIPLPPPLAAPGGAQPPGVPPEKPGGIPDLLAGLKDENEQLRLQVELVGKSAAEMQTQLALLKIRQQYGDLAAKRAAELVRSNAELTQELEHQKSRTSEIRAVEEARLRVEESRAKALKEIQGTNIEAIVQQGELQDRTNSLTNAFQDFGFVASSALQDAISNGKSLSDILSGLEQDILGILTRLLLLDPLAKGISGALGAFAPAGGGGGGIAGALTSLGVAGANLFSSPIAGVGLGTFNAINPIAAADVANPAFAAIFHGGGIVGTTAVPTRAIPSSLIARAPRLHDGGMAGLRPDEVPAILQRGEMVSPRGAGNSLAIRPITMIFNGVSDFQSIKRNLAQTRGSAREFLSRADARDA